MISIPVNRRWMFLFFPLLSIHLSAQTGGDAIIYPEPKGRLQRTASQRPHIPRQLQPFPRPFRRLPKGARFHPHQRREALPTKRTVDLESGKSIRATNLLSFHRYSPLHSGKNSQLT